MTHHEGQQVQHTGVCYAEDRSAIRWPYAMHIAGWLLLLFAGIATTAINPSMSFVPAVGMAGVVLSAGFAVKNWPVGIRVNGDGIRIGGVRLHPRPRKNLPWADWQRRHVFFCPWEGVRRAAVITDKPALRDTRRLNNRNIIRLGALTAPFTRAALLIEVDPDRVIVPEFREPDTERQFWRYSHITPVESTPVWYVPTRRPGELRAVLAQHSGYFSGHSDTSIPSHLRLVLERGDVSRA